MVKLQKVEENGRIDGCGNCGSLKKMVELEKVDEKG